MKTCLLVANEDEAKHLSELVNQTPGHEVMIMITGEGRSNLIKSVTEALRNDIIKNDDKIINVGYVGAKGFEKGSIVTIGCVEHFTPSKTIKENCIALNCCDEFQIAGCFTADNFVDEEDIDPWIPDKFVCDMELYYLALMFPSIMSIKIVSDELNFDEYKEANFEKSWEIVRNKLKEIV